jgi:Cys-tRNA(Pro)/Cys-tRNA(Cys) deacylase
LASKTKKLNSMRLLESHGAEYQTLEYSADIHSAVGVAEAIGAPPETVFKTLVALPSKGKPVLAIIPGPASLDLKALAAAVGEKKMTMAAHADAEKLTGLKVGGISALALMQKGWAVVLDASAEQSPAIVISAGQRGVNLRLAVDDLKRIVSPTVAAVTQNSV